VPLLADLDHPPRSRWPGMLWGLALALPIAGVFLFVLIPTLVQSVLGGARQHDERRALEESYLLELCTTAMEPERDGRLCSCVLATEYPALDCQDPFVAWSVDRQRDGCADANRHNASLSFCTCVEAVAAAVDAAPPDQREHEAQAYARCQALPDAFNLPHVAELAAAP
jgi:hypothetical protein